MSNGTLLKVIAEKAAIFATQSDLDWVPIAHVIKNDILLSIIEFDSDYCYILTSQNITGYISRYRCVEL